MSTRTKDAGIPAHVARRMEASQRAFRAVVWPAISTLPVVGGGSLATDDPKQRGSSALELDRRAGIDHWQVLPDGDMRGIAARVQWLEAGQCQGTMTVRTGSAFSGDTEIVKRYRAIQQGSRGHLYPWLTAHAYVRVCGDASGKRWLLEQAYVAETVPFIELAWDLCAHPGRYRAQCGKGWGTRQGPYDLFLWITPQFGQRHGVDVQTVGWWDCHQPVSGVA